MRHPTLKKNPERTLRYKVKRIKNVERKIIHFKDSGQDFLRWLVQGDVVTDSNAQQDVWVGVKIIGHPVVGKKLHIERGQDRYDLIHTVKEIETDESFDLSVLGEMMHVQTKLGPTLKDLGQTFLYDDADPFLWIDGRNYTPEQIAAIVCVHRRARDLGRQLGRSDLGREVLGLLVGTIREGA